MIWRAFGEDLGFEEGQAPKSSAAVLELDLTTRVAVPEAARAQAKLLAKADGTLAGLGVFRRAFEVLDGTVEFTARATDGDTFARGDVLAELVGSARALLVAERTALNLLQRMCGVATLTRAFVERAQRGAATGGGGGRVLDTRKTAPGLRLLQKYAVRCGGGENHRFGLADEVMLKDNHADWSSTQAESGPGRLSRLVRMMREQYTDRVRVTAEARDLPQALAALNAGADVILLDNFAPADLVELIASLRQRAQDLGRAVELEASGGINLETVGSFAATGIDRMSVGALTHSAVAIDLSLEITPVPVPGAEGPA